MTKRGKKIKVNPTEEDIYLPPYTPPWVIRLGALNQGMGRCGPGSSDTGMCQDGISPGGQCFNYGSNAGAICDNYGSGAASTCQNNGSSPGTNCLTGTSDT